MKDRPRAARHGGGRVGGKERHVAGIVSHPVGHQRPRSDAPLAIPAGVLVEVSARDEQVAPAFGVAARAVPGLEIAFAGGLLASQRDIDLAKHVVRGIHSCEQVLREGDEFLHSALHQAAIDLRIGVKRTGLKRCVQPVQPAHVALHRTVDVAPRGQIADLRLQIERRHIVSPLSIVMVVPVMCRPVSAAR